MSIVPLPRMYPEGARVFVPDAESSRGLPARIGTVEMREPTKGGALVRHDDGALLGWTWYEMRPASWIESLLSRLVWWWRRRDEPRA